jgi:hypothetical protein
VTKSRKSDFEARALVQEVTQLSRMRGLACQAPGLDVQCFA